MSTKYTTLAHLKQLALIVKEQDDALGARIDAHIKAIEDAGYQNATQVEEAVNAAITALNIGQYALDADLETLENKVEGLVTAGGEPNVIEVVKVDGVALTVDENKAVNIVMPEGYDDTALAGRVSAIEADYLKEEDKYDDTALAGRVKAIEDDYLTSEDAYDDTALSGRVKAIEDDYLKAADKYDDTELAGRVTANEKAIETLNGTGEGSVDKKITDAFNEFSTNVTDDGVVNSYKELIDYAAEHGGEFTELVGTVEEQGNAIDALEGKAHTHTNKTVLDGITEAKVTAWDAAEANAKAYADGLAGNYDAAGSAAQALADAKEYADGLVAADADVTAMLDEVFGTEE